MSFDRVLRCRAGAVCCPRSLRSHNPTVQPARCKQPRVTNLTVQPYNPRGTTLATLTQTPCTAAQEDEEDEEGEFDDDEDGEFDDDEMDEEDEEGDDDGGTPRWNLTGRRTDNPTARVRRRSARARAGGTACAAGLQHKNTRLAAAAAPTANEA